jgi:predicted transcriptional regulator of viral defense system
MGRGTNIDRKAQVNREIDFQVAYAKFGPDSAIGGLSALFYYNLAEQVPGETWVLIAPEKKSRERLS